MSNDIALVRVRAADATSRASNKQAFISVPERRAPVSLRPYEVAFYYRARIIRNSYSTAEVARNRVSLSRGRSSDSGAPSASEPYSSLVRDGHRAGYIRTDVASFDRVVIEAIVAIHENPGRPAVYDEGPDGCSSVGYCV